MNRNALWLIGLLVLWTAVAVLWMGFTVPRITGITPLNSEILGLNLELSENEKSETDKQDLSFVPPVIASKINSDQLLMNQETRTAWINWVLEKSEGHQLRAIVTGYQLSSEKDHLAMSRAKQFQKIFENYDSVDFVLVEEYRDNLKREKGKLLDVIGLSIQPYVSGKNNHFKVETSPSGINNEVPSIQRMAMVIQASNGHFLELTYCCHDAYKNLDENRDEIRGLKEQLEKMGVPRHKIIGNLQDCPTDSVRIVLELK